MPHDEDWLKGRIVKLLTGLGYFARRFPQGPRAIAGVPDIHVIDRGRACWIEAKRPGRYKNAWEGCKKDSPTQYKFLMDAQAAGAVVFCVDSLEPIEQYFRR